MVFSHPDLFAAFIPRRLKPATGGRLPGLPGPGVSPRTVRRPHAPVSPLTQVLAASGSRRRLQDDVSRSIAPRRTWLALAPDALPPRRDGEHCKGGAPYGGKIGSRICDVAGKAREYFPNPTMDRWIVSTASWGRGRFLKAGVHHDGHNGDTTNTTGPVLVAFVVGREPRFLSGLRPK